MTNEETKFVGMMKTRPYNVNNDASVDFLEDAKKCEKYSKPLCFSQGRHLSKEKKKMSVGICMHLVNYQITMFPRYKYHLELIEKHKKEYDICIPPPSTILVYGREAEVSRNLLQPLELHPTTFKDQDWEDVILVVFNNSIDGDWKTLGLDKDKIIKCRWCLIVSSDIKLEKLRDDLAADNITNFSLCCSTQSG